MLFTSNVSDSFLTMKFLFLLIYSCLLSSCLLENLFVGSEQECNFGQYKGKRIAWNNLPLNLIMDDALNPLQRDALVEAVDTIHAQYGKIIFNLVLGVSASDKWKSSWVKYGSLASDGKSSVYWITTGWPRVYSNKQAITRNRSRGNLMKETDIVINASVYDFFLVATKPVGVDLKSLYIHELLHSVGLKHIITDPVSVMNPQLAYGAQPQRRILSSVDKESLDCEYQ